MTVNSKGGGKLFRFLSQLRPRIWPLDSKHLLLQSLHHQLVVWQGAPSYMKVVVLHCKDNVLYRKLEKNIPRKEIARPQSQFLQSYIWERFIYSQDRSNYLAAAKWVDRSWEYIKRSQKYEYGNWEQGCAVWFLGIHNSNLLRSVW
jgi:hypothetical protein